MLWQGWQNIEITQIEANNLLEEGSLAFFSVFSEHQIHRYSELHCYLFLYCTSLLSQFCLVFLEDIYGLLIGKHILVARHQVRSCLDYILSCIVSPLAQEKQLLMKKPVDEEFFVANLVCSMTEISTIFILGCPVYVQCTVLWQFWVVYFRLRY